MTKLPILRGSQVWMMYDLSRLIKLLETQEILLKRKIHVMKPDRLAWLKWRINNWETLKLIGAVK